jgi:hypothetical protein
MIAIATSVGTLDADKNAYIMCGSESTGKRKVMSTGVDVVVRGGLAPESQLVIEKIAAFDRISGEVLANFPYVQDVHGQRRFSSFPILATVHYLHALWICNCKDMLLSVPVTGRRRKGSDGRFERYEGQYALELLRQWQEGKTSNLVDFLELKLDYAPFGLIMRSFEAAIQNEDRALARRLAHGRTILLNRTQNLVCALRNIFALQPDRQLREVHEACAQYGHTIEQCDEQLAAMDSALYSYVPHPALARRNMQLMNSLGMRITDNAADRPGKRTASVQRPAMPQYAYADFVVMGATTLL